MRKYWKRILAMVLAVAMVVPSVPMETLAAENDTIEAERNITEILFEDIISKAGADLETDVTVTIAKKVDGEEVATSTTVLKKTDTGVVFYVGDTNSADTLGVTFPASGEYNLVKGVGTVAGELTAEAEAEYEELEDVAIAADAETVDAKEADNRAENEVTKAQAKAFGLGATKELAKNDYDKATEKVQNAENEVTKAQENLDDYVNNIDAMLKKLEEEERKNAELKQTVDGVESLVDGLLKTANNVGYTEEAMQNCVNGTAPHKFHILVDCAKILNGLADYRKSIADTNKQIEESNKLIADYKDALGNAETDPEAAKQPFINALETAKKELADVQNDLNNKENAYNKAVEEYNQAQQAVIDAQAEKVETAKELEAKKEIEKNAWNDVRAYIASVTPDKVTFDNNKVTYEKGNVSYPFSVTVYDILKVKVEGTSANITVNGTDGKVADNQYKVLEGNDKVTVSVPVVEGYKLIGVYAGNKELTETEGVYAVGSLSGTTTLTVAYAEETTSVVNVASVVATEGVKSVTVNETEVTSHTKVDENTEVTINIETEDNYVLKGLSVKDKEDGSVIEETTDTTLTFTAGAKKTYVVNVTMEKLNNCTLTLGKGTNGTVKYATASNEAVVLTETVNLLKNTEYSVTLEPAEGFYVISLEVGTSVKKISGSATGTVTFTTGDGVDYIVNYECKKPTLALNDGFIMATELTSDDLEEKIFDAVYDTENSLPNDLTAGQVKVEYKAGTITVYGKSYDIWTDINVEPVTSESLFKIVEESTGVSEAILKAIFGDALDSFLSKFHAFGEYGDGSEEDVRITFAGNQTFPALMNTATVTISDTRVETEITGNDHVSVTYGFTEEDLYEALGLKVVAKSTEEPIGQKAVFVTDVESLNASDTAQTVKVKYAGNDTYQPCTAEFDVIINKAPVNMKVDSAKIKFADIDGSYNGENMIKVSPNAEFISFAVGFGLGNDASTDASAVAYVDLPELIDLDSIKNETVKELIQGALDKLGNGTTMNVAELKSALETFLSTAEDAEDVLGFLGINLNLESINSLVSVLEQIKDLDGIGNLTIKLTMGKGLNISDAGVYLVGAVTSDANYETAYGLNYLIITPNGKKAELDWLIEDENGFVTIGAIASGEYDLGAYVSKVYEGTEKDAEKQLVELFLGVDAEGNPILTTKQSELTFGAYTEIAFIKDLGNEMYYAVPIVRPVVVVTDLVDVKFVDLNGNENYDRIFTYDGTRKAMLAEAYDRAGNKLDSANITYRYIGIESDVENYYSSDAPTETGVYTVVAVYKEAGNTRVGMTVGAMVIQPAEASVEVKDFVAVPYTEAPVDLVDTMKITTSPADAKVAIITGSVSAKGDFSEEGLDAVVGNLNIDLPERADEILEKLLGKDMETADITVKDLQRWVAELKTEISNLEDVEIDTAAFDELLEMLKDMPNVTSITFKDSIKPSAIGAYFVGAVVFDTNYIPNADAGILLITPEVENDELSWNYNDMNGIITLPALEEQDNLLAATAATGADVKYFIVGTDEYGKEVRIHTSDISYDSLIKKGFGNGVYTQVAYIPFEADGNIAVGYPIVRSFVVAPQYVLIDFVPELNIETPVKFEYTGKPVDISTIVTYMDDTKVSEDKCNKYLTVRYVGVDSTGAEYNSTTAPTKEGVYTVTALYVERTEAGELIYAGLNVGLIEIIPASNNNNDQPGKPSGGNSGNGSSNDKGTELEGVYEAPTAPTAPAATAGASTGDSANILGYVSLFVAAGAAMVLIFFKKKRA